MSNCSESVEFKIKFLTDCIRMQRVGLIHRSIDKQTKTCARQYPRIFIPNRYKINLSNLWKMTTYFNLFINSKKFLVNFLYRNKIHHQPQKLRPRGKPPANQFKRNKLNDMQVGNHVSFLTCIVMQKRFRSIYYA